MTTIREVEDMVKLRRKTTVGVQDSRGNLLLALKPRKNRGDDDETCEIDINYQRRNLNASSTLRSICKLSLKSTVRVLI